MPLQLLLILLISLCTITVQAQVYTWINEEGVRVYGDKPPEQAQEAALPQLQEFSSPKKANKKGNENKVDENANKQETSFNYRRLEIITPKEDEMITSGAAGNVAIQLHVEPNLRPGHEVTLYLNSQPVSTEASLQFQLENLRRGSHLLKAEIKHQGTRLISSPKRRIHVQRPSILNRPRTQ
ncbi:DUF4124 domain-containing protein [Bermanella marisrubri]|uniref:DUF4124 domain-containing protein n=1 Tax=Bermanella marisrubri TaxID=207949 RepID=Q1N2H4_9GAMM|nr:DUF4124 domain-containing protein [Bermanella marisrubri]EAT12433.1 hypothetical protein RED65_16386 [Oceanobacter sp. RED65] [Bermanella marisrubri]QIZ85514.1 DUF4124 domain-containing protein [Bermanella marisrubri]